MRRTIRFALAALLLAAPLGAAPLRADDEVKITVLTILATDRNDKVDDKLKEIAADLRRRDACLAHLTGFTIARTETKKVAIGAKESFPLVDKVNLVVFVREPSKDEDGRVRLTIKPPQSGQITYSCCCRKFFPVITHYFTKGKGDRLIVAVMVHPCQHAQKE